MNALSIRILAALIVGLSAGALAGALELQVLPRLIAVAQPVGKLWLDGLTMTIVPLVFGLIVVGVISAGRSASESRTAQRSLLWFAVLLVGASALAAGVAVLALQVWPAPVQAQALRAAAGAAPDLGAAGDWLTGLVPTNPIKAAADTAMAPLVVFALLFGFAALRISAELRSSLVDVLTAVVETMLVLVQWVLWLAPIGVAALAFVVGARAGAGAAGALLHYVLLISAVCLVVTAAAYVLATGAGRMGIVRFARAALPSQVVALSTQSSLASLPAMVKAADDLDVSRSGAGVVLPLAVSLFRAASAAANVAVAIYLAHLYGVPLGLGTLTVGVLVGAAVSLAAVGLPAQVSFFASIGPVCLAMGVPLGALPLLLAVETIPDLFRTLGNVTSDLAVTRIVGAGRVAETQVEKATT